jgi:uncharacterized spore protein YtfJ
MDILGILLTILTYVLIGFGFAAGFALWRKVSAKWKKKKGKGGVRRGGWV